MTDAEYQGRWFAKMTAPQLATYNERMAVAFAYQNSPRWERIRAAAQREFHETTQGARDLYERAMLDLEAFGEVSEETNDAMDRFEGEPSTQIELEQHKIAITVHGLMSAASDLSKLASDQPSLVRQEYEDIELAHAHVGRLLERIRA